MGLKHISENTMKIGDKSYWKTDNPNIIIKLTIQSQEIHIDKLEAKIQFLEQAEDQFDKNKKGKYENLLSIFKEK